MAEPSTSDKVDESEVLAALRSFGSGHKLGPAYDYEDLCAVVERVVAARSAKSAEGNSTRPVDGGESTHADGGRSPEKSAVGFSELGTLADRAGRESAASAEEILDLTRKMFRATDPTVVLRAWLEERYAPSHVAPSESPLAWVVFTPNDMQGHDYYVFPDEYDAKSHTDDAEASEPIPLYRASAFQSATGDSEEAARYRWLTRMWPLEITRLVHSHHTHGPTSTEVHGAIKAAMAHEKESK